MSIISLHCFCFHLFHFVFVQGGTQCTNVLVEYGGTKSRGAATACRGEANRGSQSARPNPRTDIQVKDEGCRAAIVRDLRSELAASRAVSEESPAETDRGGKSSAGLCTAIVGHVPAAEVKYGTGGNVIQPLDVFFLLFANKTTFSKIFPFTRNDLIICRDFITYISSMVS